MSVEAEYERDDAHDSRRSSSRRKGGSGIPIWAWIGGGVLGLLLTANLVLALPGVIGGGSGGAVDDAPSSPLLTPALVGWLLLWLPTGLAVACAGAGLYWSTLALARYDRASVRGIRFGFSVAAIAVLAVIVAVFEQVESMDVVAMCAIAAILVPFTWAARAASKSRHGGGRKRRAKGDGDDADDSDSDSTEFPE